LLEKNGLSLPKMLSGMNSLEINEIREEETEDAITRRLECNNATSALKTAGWNFCVSQPGNDRTIHN